jgi:hypothetical protein
VRYDIDGETLQIGTFLVPFLPNGLAVTLPPPVVDSSPSGIAGRLFLQSLSFKIGMHDSRREDAG